GSTLFRSGPRTIRSTASPGVTAWAGSIRSASKAGRDAKCICGRRLPSPRESIADHAEPLHTPWRMTSTNAPDLSFVIPCHNEHDNLRPLVAAIRDAAEPLKVPYEI